MEKDKLNKASVQITIDKAASEQLPHGTVVAIIATEDLDRHGEKMSVKGIETPRKNYKAYYNHSYNGSTDLPVGIYEKLWKEGGKLMGQIKLAVAEYPFAEQLYKMVMGGYVDSMSIGFIPKEWDEETLTWTKSEFVEGSFVAEPANVLATVTAKGLDEAEAKEFLGLAKSFKDEVKSKSVDKVKSITEDLTSLSLTDIKTVLENAKQSIGELEQLVNTASTAEVDKKTLVKIRLAGKKVSKSTDKVNSTIKLKLKEG